MGPEDPYLDTPVDALLRMNWELLDKHLVFTAPKTAESTSSRIWILRSLMTIPNALVGAAVCRYFAIRMGVCHRPLERNHP